MTKQLEDELRALGLPPPSKTPEGERQVSAADILRTFMQDVFWSRPSFDVDTAFDVLQTMEAQALRLIHRLAEKGIRAVTTQSKLEMPHRGRSYLGGVEVRSEKCYHLLIHCNAEVDRVVCRDCGAGVNPIWWLARYAHEIAHGENWLAHLRNERREISAEIEELKRQRDNVKAQVRRQSKPPKRG